MTFRVIVRVLQERSFLRTQLRALLTKAISAQQPLPRPGPDAARPGVFPGLRLSWPTTATPPKPSPAPRKRLLVSRPRSAQSIITGRAQKIMAALPARQRTLPPVPEFRELLADLHAETEES